MGQKQPYFVYRNSNSSATGRNGSVHPQSQPNSYVLVAGLWKRTMTGWSDQPIMDTFTMLTTEVCPAIQWLHTRMPVLIWDEHLARQWLDNPTSNVIHDQLVQQSQQTTCHQLQWHKVTTAMSSMKFRTIEAILPYKDKQQSVKSFFSKSSTSPSPASKTKKKVDDEVVVVWNDEIKNNDTAINMSDTVEQQPTVPVRKTSSSTSSSLSLMTPNHITKKPKMGESNPSVAMTTEVTTASSTKSFMKKSSTPSKRKITGNHTSNTRTIDTFFTPKSTRK
jgi:hypothetical protein